MSAVFVSFIICDYMGGFKKKCIANNASKLTSGLLLLFPRRQNRTGSLHTVNRFHDEAGKLLLHLLLRTLRKRCSRPRCARAKPRHAALIVTPEMHTRFFFVVCVLFFLNLLAKQTKKKSCATK